MAKKKKQDDTAPPKETYCFRTSVDYINKIDAMAKSRRWKRSQMLDFIVEQFVAKNFARFEKTGDFDD